MKLLTESSNAIALERRGRFRDDRGVLEMHVIGGEAFAVTPLTLLAETRRFVAVVIHSQEIAVHAASATTLIHVLFFDYLFH